MVSDGGRLCAARAADAVESLVAHGDLNPSSSEFHKVWGSKTDVTPAVAALRALLLSAPPWKVQVEHETVRQKNAARDTSWETAERLARRWIWAHVCRHHLLNASDAAVKQAEHWAEMAQRKAGLAVDRRAEHPIRTAFTLDDCGHIPAPGFRETSALPV